MNEEGLRPDVNSLDVLISLADLYIENGLFDEAKDLLKTAIKENNEMIKPYCKLGKIHISQGEENEAFAVLKEALKISPENKEVNKLLNSLKVREVEVVEEEKEIEKTDKIEKKKEEKGRKKEKAIKLEPGSTLGEILKNLLKIKGIIGAIVVDDIGALIDAQLELPVEQESTGAIISSIYDKIGYSALDLKTGRVSKVFFELPGGNIVVLGSKFLRFIVLTTKNVLLGGLEDTVMEAFSKTIAFLGVE